MDLRYFLKVIWRRIWIILSVMAVTAVAAFLFMGKLPDTYKANAIVSTGIIEYKGINVDKENPFIQQFQVTNAFSNLIEAILNRPTILRLSRRLLEHDFATNTSTPFRRLTSEEYLISKAEIEAFAKAISLQNDNSPGDTFPDLNKSRIFNQLAKALRYDYKSIRDNLTIKRIGETDYLQIEFTSESPALSYFAVNAFCEEIIQIAKSNQTSEESSAVNFYKELVEEKRKELDKLSMEYNQYKANNNVVNLEEQTKSIVSQIRELELLRERFNKNIPSLENNIRNINFYIKKTARINADNYAASVFIHEDIREISEQLKAVTEQYYANGMNDSSLKNRMEELQKKKSDLTLKVAAQRRSDVGDVAERNRELFDKRIEKELELATARESVKSIDKEISKLNNKQNALVSNEAYLSNLEKQLQVIEKEYFDLVDKLHQAEQLSKKTDSRLSIIEPPQIPDKPEPSQRAVIAAFAGASSGIMATVLIFLLAFFDTSLSTPFKFERDTGLELLGVVPYVKGNTVDMSRLFSAQSHEADKDTFLEALRKIRFEVESSGADSFLITSTQKGAGKTFVTLALAHSLALNFKKVLILDMNFKNNSLTSFANIEIPQLSFTKEIKPKSFDKKLQLQALPERIHIAGNSGSKASPAEALHGVDFTKILHQLTSQYDYILIEGAALNDFADSRELALYTQKIIPVFAADARMTDQDQTSIQFIKDKKQKTPGGVLCRYRPNRL